MKNPLEQDNLQEMAASCRPGRRSMAILYDSVLLFAVFTAATALVLPLTGGTAIPSGNWWYTVYLFFIAYLYFTWQWGKGRQTLGMRAWHIHLVTDNNVYPGPVRLSARFLLALLSVALFGLGFIYAFVDNRGRTLHDILTGTRLMVFKPDQ